ncbi:MAG: Rrf2 family transcriptional regulator [Chloroflexaceae bacterium]|nr:Rrf2 family transcriptional regulator [Chloroflexaceae bacterium]
MELSCKTEYALLALLELSSHYQQNEPLQIRQIAAQQHIPDRYLEQLLAVLRRGGFVRSQRGPKGGYLLAREPWKITLLEVINCLEGQNPQPPKAPVSPPPTAESAMVKEIWLEAHASSLSVWQRYTLEDVCELRDARQQLNLMYYI